MVPYILLITQSKSNKNMIFVISVTYSITLAIKILNKKKHFFFLLEGTSRIEDFDARFERFDLNEEISEDFSP
jgi:hypothetical protein